MRKWPLSNVLPAGFSIPESYTDLICRNHGSAGKAWLSGFSDLMQRTIERWSLQIHGYLEPVNYNLLFTGSHPDWGAVVIKFGFPGPELEQEARALEAFQGRGTVQLRDSNLKDGILLLEHVLPGFQLGDSQDHPESVETACRVMLQIRQPAPIQSTFPDLKHWCRKFADRDPPSTPLSRPIRSHRERAAELSRHLLETSPSHVLLHGDLHHENILFSQSRGWLAVDPKGVVGDPAAEPGPFLINPYPSLVDWDQLPTVLTERIARFSRLLNLPAERIWGWGYIRAVLSGIWSIEDHQQDTADYFFTCADRLLEIQKDPW